jgi:arylsulfatase A-like enzyme
VCGLIAAEARPYRRCVSAFRRRAIFAILAAAMLATSASTCLPDRVAGPAEEGDSRRPNILIIVTDDQRFDGTLGVMPATRRWFVRNGTSFTQAYATTPLCCPSRASIFTGRYAHNHDVRGNLASDSLDHTTTLQHHLGEAGYDTAIAGKYLNGWDMAVDPPFFDHWAIFRRGYNDVEGNVNGTVQTVPGYSTDVIGSFATDFLEEFERTDDDPWFLYVATQAPHPPFAPEPRYAHRRVPAWKRDRAVGEARLDDKPRYLLTREVGTDVPKWLRGPGNIVGKAATIRRLQLRTLMSVDDLVADLFDALGRLREDRDTAAFFLSDNGYLWGEHRAISKRLPYTPSIRIPLHLRYPGRVEAGERDARLATNLDIAPSVLDAAGLTAEDLPVMDGMSLLSARGRRRHVFFEHWGPRARNKVPTWYSLRNRRFQLVWYPRAPRGRDLELYDLARDPAQLTNVLGDVRADNDPSPKLLGRLRRLLFRFHGCSGDGCPGAP